MEEVKKAPSMTQVISAQRRIHTALDKGERPSPGDVEIIGGQEALTSLLSSRSELKETIEKATEQERMQVKGSREEPISLNKNDLSSGTAPGSKEESPRKRTKAENDYYEFVANRLGPLMVFFLFIALRDWDRAAFYALSPDECDKLAGPLSHMLPRLEETFHAPKWVRTIIVTSDDTVTLLYVVAGYLERTGMLDKLLPLFAPAKKETEKKHASQPVVDISKVQQQGYQPVAYDRQAIDPRQIYSIGSQYAAD